MNRTRDEVKDGAAPERRTGALPELGICAFLLVLGSVVLWDAARMPVDFVQRGPVGPKAAPIIVGTLLVLVAVLLAVDVLRGGRGMPEGGEDVDLAGRTDLRAPLILAGAFLANAALIDVVGWPISGALLFWGGAFALGSRNLVRDPLLAIGLSLGTYLVFGNLLGIPLPAGILAGVM